jgi:hypothetical protein
MLGSGRLVKETNALGRPLSGFLIDQSIYNMLDQRCFDFGLIFHRYSPLQFILAAANPQAVIIIPNARPSEICVLFKV